MCAFSGVIYKLAGKARTYRACSGFKSRKAGRAVLHNGYINIVKHPKTDKLLKLTIDTGIDQRTIVSGIAEYYSPEDMVGKQICILANLAPRTIRGIESKGMILMAKQGDGKMRFITPQEAVVNGAQIN